MFCTKCGDALPDQSPFCGHCGTAAKASEIAAGEYTAPPSASEQTGKVSTSPPSVQAPVSPARTIPWSKFWLWVIPITVLAISLAYIGSKSNTDAPSSGASPEQQANMTWPELKFQSAGRLPTTIHGFRLGMSVAEALQVNSSLHNRTADKWPQGEYSYTTTLPDGMIVDLYFNRGRLYWILERPSNGVTEKGYSKGYTANMSPEDTAQFVRNTITILGAPNLLPYTGFRERNFVWLDGDVRAKLETEVGDDGRQSVHFDLLVFPELGGHQTDDATGASQAMTLIILKKWGEDHEPPILRPMPVGLFGLRLGMVPWQVREVFPETNISSSSTSDNREMYGGFGNEQSNLQVHFWNGTLYSFWF